VTEGEVGREAQGLESRFLVVKHSLYWRADGNHPTLRGEDDERLWLLTINGATPKGKKPLDDSDAVLAIYAFPVEQ